MWRGTMTIGSFVRMPLIVAFATSSGSKAGIYLVPSEIAYL